MTDENIRIIEVNGVKLEVDLRTAKRIDRFQIGSRVKLLIKEYSNYVVYPGTIIGFEPFDKLPTIIVAYVKRGYNECSINFLYYNSETKDHELVLAQDNDFLGLEKETVLKNMNAEIQKKEAEAEDLRRKRDYFLANFKMYWADVDDAIKRMEADA